jgi:hypothetical protein
LARKRKITGEIEVKFNLESDVAGLVVNTVGANQYAREATRWAIENRQIKGFRRTILDCLDTSKGPTTRREISNLFDQIGVALPSIDSKRLPSFLRGALTALDATRSIG